MTKPTSATLCVCRHIYAAHLENGPCILCDCTRFEARSERTEKDGRGR